MINKEDKADVKRNFGSGVAKAISKATNDSLGKKVSSWGDNLKKMMAEPASKEWFAKHGSPKTKALVKLKQPRLLSVSERAEKTKNWPKGPSAPVDEKAYQKRVGRAYND